MTHMLERAARNKSAGVRLVQVRYCGSAAENPIR